MKIQEILIKLRKEINNYRDAKLNKNVPAEISTIEIALNIVEFKLKKKKPIYDFEELWFKASYLIAYSFDGTDWEYLYIYYKKIIAFVEKHNYFRDEIPFVDWEN